MPKCEQIWSKFEGKLQKEPKGRYFTDIWWVERRPVIFSDFEFFYPAAVTHFRISRFHMHRMHTRWKANGFGHETGCAVAKSRLVYIEAVTWPGCVSRGKNQQHKTDSFTTTTITCIDHTPPPHDIHLLNFITVPFVYSNRSAMGESTQVRYTQVRYTWCAVEVLYVVVWLCMAWFYEGSSVWLIITAHTCHYCFTLSRSQLFREGESQLISDLMHMQEKVMGYETTVAERGVRVSPTCEYTDLIQLETSQLLATFKPLAIETNSPT